MNFKTTVGLFIAVVALGAGIVFLQKKNPPPRPTLAPISPSLETVADKKLFETPLGAINKIQVQRDKQLEWTFARSKESGEWRMIAPGKGEVQKWQVEQIANTLTGLTYAVSYDSGSTVTLKSAGLDPPRAVVTLTDENDKSVTVRVGRQEGANEAYVALGDDDTIYRVKRSLQYLLKKSHLDYYERKLVDAKPEFIVRFRIESNNDVGDRDVVVVARSGTGWEFQKPVRATGMSETLDKLCTTFSSLNVVAWVDDDVDDPSVFGVDDDALAVTATVRKDAPAAEAESADHEEEGGEGKEDIPPLFEDVTVRFSAVHPLGEDNKVYVRRGDEKRVGTVMLTIADQFKPDLSQWRDNRLTTSDPMTARKVTLTVGDQTATFVRRGLGWSYEDSGEPADRTELESLLRRIKETDAVNFVNDVSDDSAAFGFDEPKGVIQVAFDDDRTETFTIGGFTDARTKRLVYVRCGESGSVAKVRVNDVTALLRPPVTYRDRTIVEVDKEKFIGIEIRRKSKRSGEPDVAFTLAKEGDAWRMTAPVEGDVDAQAVDQLLSTLSNMRGRELIDAGGDLSSFGLDKPDVTLSYTYLPPVIYKMKPRKEAEASEDGESGEDQPQKLDAEPYQPPAETLTLHASNKNNNLYLIRESYPDLVYVITKPAFEQFNADYRDRSLFDFEASVVTQFALTVGEETEGFEKKDDGWAYQLEPDIPIDSSRVTNYLLRVKDLKADRFVDFDADDLSAYGLDAPSHKLVVTLDDGTVQTLLISKQTTQGSGRYAAIEGGPIVVALEPDAIDRIKIDIAEFEQP